MKLRVALLLTLLASALAGPAARAADPAETLNQERAKRGWFFYEDPVKEQAPKAESAQPDQAKPKKPKEERCKGKAGWTPDCGFIDPGSDFEFQAKQRDVLIERMSVSNNDAKAVEDFQRYMHWAVGRATEVANLWYYNTIQNPDLDASVSRPISQFGVRLMSEVQSNHDKDIFKALVAEGAALVFFTRSDCSFCHSMAPLVSNLSDTTGLEVWNAALDGKCEPAFKDKCRTGEAVQVPAQALQVTIVPTLFLALPDNTWIRVSTGVTDATSIRVRIVTFFSAYRTALLKGVKSEDGKPSVDFSGGTATGTAKGVTAPTAGEISRMLDR